jgi:hypothetical protein
MSQGYWTRAHRRERARPRVRARARDSNRALAMRRSICDGRCATERWDLSALETNCRDPMVPPVARSTIDLRRTLRDRERGCTGEGAGRTHDRFFIRARRHPFFRPLRRGSFRAVESVRCDGERGRQRARNELSRSDGSPRHSISDRFATDVARRGNFTARRSSCAQSRSIRRAGR